MILNALCQATDILDYPEIAHRIVRDKTYREDLGSQVFSHFILSLRAASADIFQVEHPTRYDAEQYKQPRKPQS